MKVGDKVLCYKSWICSYNKKRIYYQKDKYYTLELGRDKYEFLVDGGSNDNWYFDIRENTDNYYGQFFLTHNDERKLKLERLQCIE